MVNEIRAKLAPEGIPSAGVLQNLPGVQGSQCCCVTCGKNRRNVALS